MKSYKYVLLDWDGNLAKTLDIWLEACRVPLARRGLNLTDQQIALSFGAFTKHIEEWGLADEAEQIMAEADVIAKEKLPNVELYPDALQVLESLKEAGKKLALITTSPHENIQHILAAHDMERFFDALVAYEDTENHKPHPEPLEKALQNLDGTKEAAVMVGDSDKDLGAANNAGIDSVLFYPDEHKKFYDVEELKILKPTYLINDFKQLVRIVGQGG